MACGCERINCTQQNEVRNETITDIEHGQKTNTEANTHIGDLVEGVGAPVVARALVHVAKRVQLLNLRKKAVGYHATAGKALENKTKNKTTKSSYDKARHQNVK